MKKENKPKFKINVIINLIIFAGLAVLFAILPRILFTIWFPDTNEPQYAGDFAYVMHDICPCHTGEDECSGYYACGADKANITYNLDNAPEDELKAAKIDDYFENQIESVRRSATIMRRYTYFDICYLLSFLSLVAGVIYFIHNKGIINGK